MKSKVLGLCFLIFGYFYYHHGAAESENPKLNKFRVREASDDAIAHPNSYVHFLFHSLI